MQAGSLHPEVNIVVACFECRIHSSDPSTTAILQSFHESSSGMGLNESGLPAFSSTLFCCKLKPSIAYFLVKLFTKEGEKVLDPFSGVGTIPFEACSQGRVGIGSDISPVAYHATRAKLDPPSPSELREQLALLNNYIRSSRESIAEEVEEELIPFYHPETLREILARIRNKKVKWVTPVSR
jgi:adenine-specific DNA methylase